MSPSTQVSQFDTSRWEKSLEEEYARREGDRLQLLRHAKATLPVYFADKRVVAVYLTGSLLREGQFRDFSDVDIAVEGLGENYFEVLVQLEDLLDRGVKLIELESTRFAKAIRQKGRRVV